MPVKNMFKSEANEFDFGAAKRRRVSLEDQMTY